MGKGSAGRSRSGSASVTVVRFAFPQLSSVWHTKQKFTKAFLFEKEPIETQNNINKEEEQLKQKEKVEDPPIVESVNTNEIPLEDTQFNEEFYDEEFYDEEYITDYDKEDIFNDYYEEYDDEYYNDEYDMEEYWLRKLSNQKAGFEIKRKKTEINRDNYSFITKPIIKHRGCKQIWVKTLAYNQANKRFRHYLDNILNKKVNIDKKLLLRGLKRVPPKYPVPSVISTSSTVKNTPPPVNKTEQDEISRAIRESLATSSVPETGLTAQQLLDLQNRELTPEDYELLLMLDESVKPKTISASIVDSFPTRKANSNDISKDPCGVCLVEFCEGDDIKSLPCGHIYHAECISKWLTERSTKCPLYGLSLEK